MSGSPVSQKSDRSTASRKAPRPAPATTTPPVVAGSPSSGTQAGAPTCLRDFYTAAQLATLLLPGLPRLRHKIAEKATREGWAHREREGRGGGREFEASALPLQARAELLRRHLAATRSASSGASTVSIATDLGDGATQRLAAKVELLSLYDRFRGDRSHNAALQAFADHYNSGSIAAPAWLRAAIPDTSARTIRRALALRKSGQLEALGGNFAGRRSMIESDRRIGEICTALLVSRPHLDSGHLRDLLKAQHLAGEIDALPHVRTIQRFVAAWREKQRAPLLSIANPDRFRSVGTPALGRADQGIERINQLWEIDASPSDVLCADGRHSIYVVIDVRTRRMMALVTRTPRTEAALLLLRRAIVAWGVPDGLKTDNGTDFVSFRMLDALKRLGIVHHELPPYSPDRKPFVERGIGTIQRGFMRLMPGFIGHSVADRQALRARKSFAARLGEDDVDAFCVELPAAELQARLDLWLDNVYASREHEGLGGATPAMRAQLDSAAHPPKRIDDEAALSWLLMAPVSGDGTRVVGKKGISVGGRDYWCEAFIVGETVHVRLDPDDVGTVWCYTGDPWRFVGRAINPELAGLSRTIVAAQAKSAQGELIRASRAELRRARRKVDTAAIIDLMLHARDAEAGRVVTLPPRSAPTHTTDDLAAAALARATGLDIERPLPEPTPQRRADHQAFVVDFERARSARDQSRDEAPLERFQRWLAVDRAIRAGKRVSDDEQHWHGGYRRDPEWSAMRMLHDAIEPVSNTGDTGS